MASDYTFALSVVPLGVALGIFLSIFLKETNCVSQAKEDHERIFAAQPIPATVAGLEPELEAELAIEAEGK